MKILLAHDGNIVKKQMILQICSSYNYCTKKITKKTINPAKAGFIGQNLSFNYPNW